MPNSPDTLRVLLTSFACVVWYENPQTAGFVGFAVCLVVWTPLLILTPDHVDISLVVKKIFKK